MALVDVVDDLITLQQLAEHERDEGRRRSLVAIRSHVAGRDQGAKVSEAAAVLDVSAPTVRAWIEAQVLRALPGSSPIRVEVVSLAAAKRAVDDLRRHTDDRRLLADVMRFLRDRAALSGDDVATAIDDVRRGRTTRLDRGRLDTLLPERPRAKRSSST